jgi:pyruvate/2-oxoacid:ferredoxin oxidoreductase beta subunit
VELSRLVVLNRIFPLYEVEDGVNYRLNLLPEEYLPVDEYLKLQKRFSSLDQLQVGLIQENVERRWDELCHKAGVVNTHAHAAR